MRSMVEGLCSKQNIVRLSGFQVNLNEKKYIQTRYTQPNLWKYYTQGDLDTNEQLVHTALQKFIYITSITVDMTRSYDASKICTAYKYFHK